MRAALACLGLVLAASSPAHAAPGELLVGLAPADDARRVIAIGPAGEVYAPDGNGAWIRTARIATADKLSAATRIGNAVVAFGEGMFYRLAANGWTVQRVAQKGKAVMGSGPRLVAAIGRQVFALDQPPGAEPVKLAVASTTVLAIGAGKGIVLQTDRGLHRLVGTKLVAVPKAPAQIIKLVSDQWVLGERGAFDLRSGRLTPWPADLSIEIAEHGPNDRLVAVGTAGDRLELVTVRGTKLERQPITASAPGIPVGVVLDRNGRVAIALRDGRILLRENDAWTESTVREELPPQKPGSPPATSP